EQVFVGSFKDFLTPYSVILGIFAVSLFMMHGCIYLIMKTQDELQQKLSRWVYPSIIFFIVMYVITTIATFIYSPHMLDCMNDCHWFLFLPAATILIIANIPREVRKGNVGRAFICSCL